MAGPDFSSLKALQPSPHLAVLCGPVPEAQAAHLKSLTQSLSGSTFVKAAQDADVSEALYTVLRSAPAVLALSGPQSFCVEIMGGVLALREGGVPVPPMALLAPNQGRFSGLSLGTAGAPLGIFTQIKELIAGGKLQDTLRPTPLLRVQSVGEGEQLGLILALGAYASAFGEGFEKIYTARQQYLSHVFPTKPDVDDEKTKPKSGQLDKISLDSGGSLSMYLHGGLVTTLPLGQEGHKVFQNRPIGYLATEQSRKARWMAARYLLGKLAANGTYLGVHSGQAQSLTIRASGACRLDEKKLMAGQTVNVSATVPLDLIDLAKPQQP